MSAAIAAQKPEIKTELPGPNARVIIKADSEFVNPAYPRPDFKLVAQRAQGVWVEDVDGNVFLDCNAGVAVCSTGHCHPEVVRAIQEQTEQLIHICGTDYYYQSMPDLARKLDEIVPIDGPTRTHFGNSGTEAVETALKLAMHATGREKFISFFGSFHGRTLGSLSLTNSKVAQRRGFKRQLLDVVHVPFPNEYRNPFSAEDCGNGGPTQGALNWIENRLFQSTTPPEEVAAIIVEPVQGEGGYVPAPKGFLEGLRRICDQHGILLIFDEVQSGMGRTGKMFAADHYDAKADIVCIAKGIASGLPLCACVARADVMDWKPGARVDVRRKSRGNCRGAENDRITRARVGRERRRGRRLLETRLGKANEQTRLHRRRARHGIHAGRRVREEPRDQRAGPRTARSGRDGQLQSRPGAARVRG
jgi:4-aminobutyrate aminotransferase